MNVLYIFDGCWTECNIYYFLLYLFEAINDSIFKLMILIESNILLKNHVIIYTSATRKKNFDFYNDTSANIFSHPYISYIASERLQGDEQFHFLNYLLEILVPMPKRV